VKLRCDIVAKLFLKNKRLFDIECDLNATDIEVEDALRRAFIRLEKKKNE